MPPQSLIVQPTLPSTSSSNAFSSSVHDTTTNHEVENRAMQAVVSTSPNPTFQLLSMSYVPEPSAIQPILLTNVAERDPSDQVETNDLEMNIRLGPVRTDHVCSGTRDSRSFRTEWQLKRPWLEFSIKLQKTFCFPCRLFVRHQEKIALRGHSAFIIEGFDDWKHALDTGRGFAKHEHSAVHRVCSEMWNNYKTILESHNDSGRIGPVLSTAYHQMLQKAEEQRLENRRYIGVLINLMVRIVRLGLPSRGHDETQASCNRGVFLEFLDHIREIDPFLDSQLISRPNNAHYTSPESQNLLIKCIGQAVLQDILVQCKNADFYSVMMDETTDLSHKEQVAICIRYCSSKFEINERLIAVKECPLTTGEQLTSLLLSVIKSNMLPTEKLIGQSYDGAAAMSGRDKGVHARIKEIAPYATFIHCRAHATNLVIVKACSINIFARHFFGTVEQLFVLIEGSAKRHSWFLEFQEKKNVSKIKHLKALSNTRWNCQGRSISVIKSRLSSITATLSKIMNDSCTDKSPSANAVGLLKAVECFEFIVGLVFFEKLLLPLDCLTSTVQGPDCDLHQVSTICNATYEELSLLRKNLDSIFEEARDIAASELLPTSFGERLVGEMIEENTKLF
jgi:hypothetical protein